MRQGVGSDVFYLQQLFDWVCPRVNPLILSNAKESDKLRTDSDEYTPGDFPIHQPNIKTEAQVILQILRLFMASVALTAKLSYPVWAPRD